MRAVLNKIYISNRLKEKLSDIPEYPLTTVVAPAGYGKSNAIRYFVDTLPKDSKILWQNVLGSGTTDFWRGFCSMFESVSTELADALSSMGAPPTDGTPQQEFLRMIRLAGEGQRGLDLGHLSESEVLFRNRKVCRFGRDPYDDERGALRTPAGGAEKRSWTGRAGGFSGRRTTRRPRDFSIAREILKA